MCACACPDLGTIGSADPGVRPGACEVCALLWRDLGCECVPLPHLVPMDTMTLAFAATFTCELIGRWVEFWLKSSGLTANVMFGAYGQLERELRSPLVFRGASCCIGLLRMADWHHGESFDAEKFAATLDTFVASIRAALLQLHAQPCLI